MSLSEAAIRSRLGVILGAVSGITGGVGVVHTRTRCPAGVGDDAFATLYKGTSTYNGWEIDRVARAATWDAYPVSTEATDTFAIRGWYEWTDTDADETAWQALLQSIEDAVNNDSALRALCTKQAPVQSASLGFQETMDNRTVRHVVMTVSFRFARKP